jgi:vanillate/3-O-methylgallate O-demethylase
MTSRSLQDVLDSVPSIAEYLYNDTPGPHSRTNSGLVPIPQEWTNWRDEQLAWRNSAVLFDQSHHMPELFVSGPGARELLTRVGVNSFTNLRPGIAKQLVACNEDGQVIGDCILHDLGNETFELISGKTLLNWVHYQAEASGLDVTAERDENTSDNATGRRRNFRFGMDGPNARKIFSEVVQGDAPGIKFFRSERVQIAGTDVMALGHGMAGHYGVELSGPFERADAVRNAILEAGEKHGLRRGGTKAYYSTGYESGWIGYPLPAIYTADHLRGFREWLPADGWEAKYQLGGSFYSPDVRDWYVNPYELGYRRIINFDHDFFGREALERMAAEPLRERVTLVWDRGDVAKILNSVLDPDELPYKYMDLPVADFGFPQRDEVQDPAGRYIGQSQLVGFTMNERAVLSLAFVEPQFAKPGTEVLVVWGEPDGGSRKPRVERHRQFKARAVVGPAPYASAARSMKTSARA